jgi:hypothetical protein
MASRRLDLTPSVIKDSLKLAAEGSEGIVDFCDVLQPYLVLRVRGHSASWLVKTRLRSLKIGDAIPPATSARLPKRRKRGNMAARGFVGLREARERAKREWAALDTTPVAPPKPTTWTWGDLARAYKKYISEVREDSNGRPKYPSKETMGDVERAFAHSAIGRWEGLALTGLNEDDFDDALAEVHRSQNWDAHRKVRAYVQAALNYGLKHRRRESGLSREWWKLVPIRARTEDEVKEKDARDRRLRKTKIEFQVQHLGMVLAEHERFCLARIGNQRVSPGVRWGLWWDALTAHRRGSGTWVALEDIKWTDPRGGLGWGLATWQPEIMKTGNEFTLPIPPFGIHIMRCMLRDYKLALERVGMKDYKSKWLFASRVIQSEAGDIAVSGSAMANHLRSLRGLRKHKGANHRDVLKGVPHFSMHTIRSVMGGFLLEHTGLPAGTASLMIDHAFPGDRLGDLQKLAPTTKQYYVLAQRIPQKTEAMAAWSDALLEAFKAAGGIYPT